MPIVNSVIDFTVQDLSIGHAYPGNDLWRQIFWELI